jgi:hypothetical protein
VVNYLFCSLFELPCLKGHGKLPCYGTLLQEGLELPLGTLFLVMCALDNTLRTSRFTLSGNYYFQENTIRMKVHFKEIDALRKTLSGKKLTLFLKRKRTLLHFYKNRRKGKLVTFRKLLLSGKYYQDESRLKGN